ncbi:MAG: fused MFS/spermidine synthase [Rhizobiales bacterium]|nr:fused MFS/spermidine synthase [Hyphomicrobiales bacterium]
MNNKFTAFLMCMPCFLALSSPLKAEKLLEKVESPYNTIYIYKQTPYITLAFGHKSRRYVESRRNPNDLTELPVEYTKSFTIGLAYPKNLKSFLMIGMGGGSTSWYLHKALPKAKVVAVELDPEIIRLSRKYYGFKENGKQSENFIISELDGRMHILRKKQKHDIIFVDAYRGQFVPFHLMTKEFFKLAKKRLSKGGVMVQNIEPSTMLYDSAIATISSVFDHVDVYRGGGNIVAIAYDGEKKPIESVIDKATELQETHNFRYALPDLIQKRAMLLDFNTKTKPLTDDFAPVNMLKTIKTHNEKRDR